MKGALSFTSSRVISTVPVPVAGGLPMGKRDEVSTQPCYTQEELSTVLSQYGSLPYDEQASKGPTVIAHIFV